VTQRSDYPTPDERAQQERAQLVRLCGRLTGDPSAADDLAQETLLTAWRLRGKLQHPSGRDRWLAAIARNLCRRWARQQARELVRTAGLSDQDDWPDTAHVGDALERRELVDLLQRALALLPPRTRTALVARYVFNTPHARIAERLGVSEDAVAMRLARGKQQLRQILTTDFAAAATAYGLVDGAMGSWSATHIWCPRCGAARLLALLPPAPAPLAFRCPRCAPDPDMPDFAYQRTNAHFARLIGARTRPTWILKHTAAWAHTYFRQVLEQRPTVCTHCGRPVERAPAASGSLVAQLDDPQFVFVHCLACGTAVSASLAGMILSLPPVQQFWRTHRRIRRLPVYEIDRGGQPALVSRFERVADRAQLVIVTGGDTCTVLEVDGAPAPAVASP